MGDLTDIKETYAIFNVAGTVFKIAYDHNNIAELEAVFNKGYGELLNDISSGKINKIKDILEFCKVGFYKYSPELKENPEALEAIFSNVENYRALFDVCLDEFYKKVMSPTIYAHISEGAKEIEKKIQKALTEKNTGQGNYTSQPKFLDSQKNGFGVPTLASLWRSIIRIASQKG